MVAPAPALDGGWLAQQAQRARSRLLHRLGLHELEAVDDAVQTAVLRALQAWPATGLPQQPLAWLTRVAWNAWLDHWRLRSREAPWPEDPPLGAADAAWVDGPETAASQGAAAALAASAVPGERFAGELHDDELALLFGACHPMLPQATQVALALRALTNLDLAPLAEGLLTTEAALAQRLARARRDLQGVDLGLPAGKDLPPRREAVLTTLALLFHAGRRQVDLRACEDIPNIPCLPRLPLCWEAIRLARALAAHPAASHPDAHALAAMLLLHGARLSGRFDAAGEIVPLPGQPRDRWDRGMVRLGLAHLQAAQQAGELSRWHLQAGMAAEHAVAPNYETTRWPTVVSYYEQLLALDDSAAPRLGHAIALAEAGHTGAARLLLLALLPTVPAALRAHALAALSRTHEREGCIAAAREPLRQAIAAARHGADARLLQKRLDALG